MTLLIEIVVEMVLSSGSELIGRSAIRTGPASCQIEKQLERRGVGSVGMHQEILGQTWTFNFLYGENFTLYKLLR